MEQEIADSKLIDTWGSGGIKIEPDISKIIEGWQLGEQPPHEYMNWLQNTFGSKLNHILKNGVAEWNNETEYLAGSSVKHSGNVWICETTNTNSEPTDLNANWEKIAISKDLTVTVDTLADLRSISYPANTVWASGYHAKNDSAFGSHIFRLKGVKTTETDNGGTVIISTIGGIDYVYELQYDGAVNVKWFGAKGDWNGTTGTDNTTYIQNAINCVAEVNLDNLYNKKSGSVFIPNGAFRYTGTLYMPSHIKVYGENSSFYAMSKKYNDSSILYFDNLDKNKSAIRTANVINTTASLCGSTDIFRYSDILNGTTSYVHSVTLRDFTLISKNNNMYGILLCLSPLSEISNVSSIGFDLGITSIACWNSNYNNIKSNAKQIALYLESANATTFSGVFTLPKTTSPLYVEMTELNKPTLYNANDNIVKNTNVYIVGSYSLSSVNVCCEGGDRGVAHFSSNVDVSSLYLEYHPLNVGCITSYKSVLNYNLIHSESNGVTLFNCIIDSTVNVNNISGIYGILYPKYSASNGNNTNIYFPNGVNQKHEFPDRTYNPLIHIYNPTNINNIYVDSDSFYSDNSFNATSVSPITYLPTISVFLKKGYKNIVHLSNRDTGYNFNVYDEINLSGYDVEFVEWDVGGTSTPTIRLLKNGSNQIKGFKLENTNVFFVGIDFVNTQTGTLVQDLNRIFGVSGVNRIAIKNSNISLGHFFASVIQTVPYESATVNVSLDTVTISGTAGRFFGFSIHDEVASIVLSATRTTIASVISANTANSRWKLLSNIL